MCIGYGSYDGYCRTYVKFPNLNSVISGAYISKATLKVKERHNTKPYAKLGIYRVLKSWSLSKITYKNQPTRSSTASATCALKGGTNSHTLTLTSLVRGWAKGSYSNYGVVLKATSESSSVRNFCALYGSRYSTASYRPVLTVDYIKPSHTAPTKPTVSVDKPYIKKGTGNVVVSWSGLNTNILKSAQIKVGGVFDYKNITGGETGSYTIDTSGLAEGVYTVYVRGIDKLDKTGTAGTVKFTVDETGPEKPKSVAINTSRQDNQENIEKVKVTVDITPGVDLPTGTASGIGKHTVELFDANSNQLIESKDTTTNLIDFTDVTPDHKRIYVKVKTLDKVGNASEVYTSNTVNVKNVLLPNFDATGSFESNLETNPWRSKKKTYTTVSWDAEYDGKLGRITAGILNEDDTVVGEEFNAKDVLVESEYPKKHSNFRLDKLFDLTKLAEGKYKVVFSFYPESEMNETEPAARTKELPLYIDNTAPKFIPIEQADPNSDPKYIMLDTEEPLTGMVQVSYGAKDTNGDLGNAEVALIGIEGTYKTLTESEQVYNFNTTEYDDGEYTIRVTQEDRAGNSTTVERAYTIFNPAPTPKIVLKESYGGPDDPIEFTYSYPAGDSSTSKVVKLEAALVAPGKEPLDADYTDLELQEPGTGGETSFTPGDLPDGIYELCIRAVDASGNKGKVRRARYVVDDTDPVINLESPKDEGEYLGYIKVDGTISDTYLRSYDISIAQGETTQNDAFENVYTFDNPKEADKVQGLLGFVDISDDNRYPSGSIVTIRIDAQDKNGNRATAYRTVTKREAIMHPADFEIQKGENGKLTVSNQEEGFALVKDGASYTANSPTWYIDGEKASPDAEGKLDFSDIAKYPDDSIHSIGVYDKVDNGDIAYGVPSMEYMLFSAENIRGNETNTEYVYEKNIVSNEDVMSIYIDSVETKPVGSEIKYYIKVEDGEYIETETGKDILLTEEPYASGSLRGKNISVKAVLKKNTADTLPSISTLSVSARSLNGDIFRIGLMDKYNPVSVTEIPKLNYKVKISWEMPEGIDTEGLTYEIYRSTSEDFSDSNTVLVQEGVTDTSWYDNYTLIDRENNANNHEGSSAKSGKIPNADFYYKVVAVKAFGEDVRKSSGTEGSGVMLPSMNEYTKRLGNKGYWGYSDHDIGAGTAMVEQSTGNFVYSETDAYVKGKALDLSMERTYNSMSTGMTPLGYSWDFSFNPILLETYDSYGDNTGILFKDGEGTIYTFLSIKSEVATETITKEGTEEIEKIKTHYRSPLGVYIHLTKIEMLDIDDADQDGDKEEVVDINYTIQTLSGDVYTFNRNSQISSYKDSNNNVINYKYDETGRLTEVENPAGNKPKITFHYSEEGNQELSNELIRYITLPNGQIVKYEYTDKKMLRSSKLYGRGDGSAVDIDNLTNLEPAIETSYDYTTTFLEGRIPLMTKLIDPNKNESRVKLKVDETARGRCEEVIYPNEDKVEYSYIKADDETQLYDETTESVYVKKGLFAPKIGESKYRYNADGNITWSEDIEGRIIQTEYRLGLEVKSYGDVDVYDIGDNGIISHRIERVANETTYDAIPDTETVASKIGSTKGNIKTEKDSAGNITKYSYAQTKSANAANPTSIKTDAADGKDMNESFKYDDYGNLLEAHDDDTGESVKYTYDSSGQVIKESFYGTGGNLTDSTVFTYDAQGNILEEKSTNGSSPNSNDKYIYDNYGRVIYEKDSRNFVTEHIYDVLDREEKTVYYTSEYKDNFTRAEVESWKSGAANVIEETTYDKNGNILSETDREGRVTTYTYDNMDRVTRKTVTKGEESIYWTYNYTVGDVDRFFVSGNVMVENASITIVKNAEGEEVSVSYTDKAGNIVKNVEKGISTSYRYNKDGEIIELYTVGKDSDNQGASTGITVLASYNKHGDNIANILAPGYDSESGNYFIDEETSVMRYEYDSLGNARKVTDPLGHTISSKYDSNGQITSVTTGIGYGDSAETAITRVKYDIQGANGNTLTEVTDAESRVSETETDPNGNVVRITDKGLGKGKSIETTFKYDALGNLVSETDANGTKWYSYDDMNNMTKSVSRRDSEHQDLDYSTYTYDNFGTLTSRKDYRDGTLERIALFKYDNLKRLVKYYQGEEPSKDSNGSYVNVDWIEYSYDIEENLTKIKYPAYTQIDEVNYSYGKYDRLQEVRVRKGNENYLARKYFYRDDNRVSSVWDYRKDSEYLEKSFEYDHIGRTTGISIHDSGRDEIIESHSYSYDKNGNITSEEMMNKGATVGNNNGTDFDAAGAYHIRRDYTYDVLNQLSNVKEYEIGEVVEGEVPDEALVHEISYTFDKTGNRTSETVDGEKTLYTYDEYGLEQLVKTEVEGDTEETKTKIYTYNEAGALKRIVDNESETDTKYEYDAYGQLTRATVTEGEGESATASITENKYDGTGTRVSKSVNGNTTNYLISGSTLLATYTVNNNGNKNVTSENVFGIDGKIIQTVRSNGAVYVYNGDLRGSTTSIVDSAGSIIQVCRYDVYGEPNVYGKDNLYNEILYTGAVYDESTGLYYLSSRYYDNTTGRFLSMDSVRGNVEDPLSMNLYGYCVNNPIKYTDRQGTSPVVAGAIFGAVLGAGAEIITQHFIEKEKINWKKVVVRGLGGAISGAMAGMGIPPGAGMIVDFNVGMLENVACNIIDNDNGKIAVQDLGEAAVGAIGGEVIGTLGGKVFKAGEKTFSKTIKKSAKKIKPKKHITKK